MNPAIAIFLVLAGCSSNVVFLELLVKDVPSSGNLITFCQFLFIAIEGFVLTMKFGTRKPVIPLSTYAIMVAIFFLVQVSNNYAFAFNISMTLHMIFRAGSLMANLILGVIILKRRYKLSKYIAVGMITVGIAMATLASADDVSGGHDEDSEEGIKAYFTWLTGISILTFALFMSARMGIYQETVYAKYGKHPAESLFFNHALPLPGFIFIAQDIVDNAKMLSQSSLYDLPSIGIQVPVLWLVLLGNVLTQYMCIKSVFILTTECTSLTVTLVVTLRKFISLLFSIFYFNNPFTVQHWIATSLVFGGTLLFTETFTNVYNAVLSKKKAE